MDAIGNQQICESNEKLLCSNHFTSDMFIDSTAVKPNSLKTDAIPIEFNLIEKVKQFLYF